MYSRTCQPFPTATYPLALLLFLFLSSTLARAQSTAPASQPSPLQILTKSLPAPDSAYAPTNTAICVGGIPSPVHQARIKISLALPPHQSDIVKISLINGGEGAENHLAAWRFAPPPVSASLRVDSAPKPLTFTAGDPAPISLTTTGILFATLTSANVTGATTIKVEVPAQHLTATSKVIFADPVFKFTRGTNFSHGVSNSGTLVMTFNGTPVDGHLIKISISKIEFKDRPNLLRQLGLTEFGAFDMSPFIDVGGDGRFSYFITQASEPEHTFFMTQTADFNGTIEYQADDLTSGTPPYTPTDPISRQWLRWNTFINAWQSANPQPCAPAFAGYALPNKLTLAQALKVRGPRTNFTPRIYFPTQNLHPDFPMLLSITTFWTLPNPDPKTALKFHATQELFDIKPINLVPTIVGYTCNDATDTQSADASAFIRAMLARLYDRKLSDAQKVASGVSAAIACAQIADTGRLWNTLQYLHDLDLEGYPEQFVQIQGILTTLCKNDPIPPEYQSLASQLLPKK